MFKKSVFAVLATMAIVATPAAAAEPALDWWGPKTVAPDAIGGVDCPTNDFCIAVDVEGNAITATDPMGEWKAVDVTASSPRAVSCASPSLCVAVGTNGEMITSTAPAGGAAAWVTRDFNGVGHMWDVDCAPGACAASDGQRILLSGNPTGGVGGWFIAEPVGNELSISALDCPSSQMCVAAGEENRNLGSGVFTRENVFFWIHDPVGPGRQFKKTYLDLSSNLSAVSCPGPSFCVVVDELGEAWMISPPVGDVRIQARHRVHLDALVDVSCPVANFCAALGVDGQAVTSTNPLGGPADWAAEMVSSGVESISCPSTSLCVAAGLNEVTIGLPPTREPPPTPPSQPPFFPSPDRASMFAQSLVKVRNGKAKLILTCAGPYTCSGTAKLQVDARGARSGRSAYRTVGSGSFSFGGRGSLTVKLNKWGRQYFGKKRRAQGRIRIDASSSIGHPVDFLQLVTFSSRR